MNPQTRPIATGNFWGNQVEKNNEAFMLANQQGQDTAPMIDKARQLAMPNFLENTTGMNLSQRQGLFNSPMPMADTGEGGFRSNRAPDPFSGGYQPRGKGDPYGKLPRRPKGFAMGGTMGVMPSLADSIRMTGNKISAINQGLAPDNALLMGKQYWQGLDQELAQQRSQGFAMGGTLDGPGGPTDDMIPAVVDGVQPVRLSDGEEIVDAKTRDFFGKKFFLDLKKKAMKGEMEGMQMQKPQEGKFAEGATARSFGQSARQLAGDYLGNKADALRFATAPYKAMAVIGQDAGRGLVNMASGVGQAVGDFASGFVGAPAPQGPTLRLGGMNPEQAAQAAPQVPLNLNPPTTQDVSLNGPLRGLSDAFAYGPPTQAEAVGAVVGDQAYGPTMMDSPAVMNALNPQPLAPMQGPMNRPLPTAEDVRFNGLAARAALDAQKPAFRPAPLTMTEKERAGMTRPSKTPLASPEMEAALTGLSGMAKRQARQQFQADEALFNRADQRGQAVEQRQAAQQAVQQDVARAKDFTDWLQKDEIRTQRDIEAEGRANAISQARTKEERAYLEGLAKQDTKEKEERARNFVQIPDTRYKVNGLGSVVDMDGKPVGLTPEEADKIGLVVKGADSKGNLTYAAKPQPKPQGRVYIGPNGSPITLQPGFSIPEGLGYVELKQDGAAPAANTAAPTSGNITKEAYAKLKPGDTYIWNGETKTKR